MENIYEEMNKQYSDLCDKAKDAICDRMKELGHVRFNFAFINVPFINSEGDFKPANVVELRYDVEYFGDVTVTDDWGDEWSIQDEGTLDGCLELIRYLEEGAYEVIK